MRRIKTDALLLTHGLPQACIVLAAALFINYICCGAAAGKVIRFAGLRQAPHVVRHLKNLP